MSFSNKSSQKRLYKWFRRCYFSRFINFNFRHINCIIHIYIHISPMINNCDRRFRLNINEPMSNLFWLFFLFNIFNGLVLKKNNISASNNLLVNQILKSVTKVIKTITKEDALFRLPIKLRPFISRDVNKCFATKHSQMTI